MADYRVDLDGYILRNGTPMTTDEIIRALKNHDALAAHVERLTELLERAQTGLDWYRDTYPEADSGADDEHATEVEVALAEKPGTASLGRQKLLWQAEALDRHAEGIERDNEPTDVVCVEDVLTLLLHEAATLRRQAEEEL